MHTCFDEKYFQIANNGCSLRCVKPTANASTSNNYLGFAKPHLLLSASQSGLTAHEINWVRLSCLAYVQLWLARDLNNRVYFVDGYWHEAAGILTINAILDDLEKYLVNTP